MRLRSLCSLALALLPYLAAGAPLEEQLRDLDEQLSHLTAHGVNFPQTLELHRFKALAYARATDSDCAAHSAAAEREAQFYLENPYAALLPSYAAHRLSLEAELAFSRGQCAADEAELVTHTEVARDKASEGIGVAASQHLYDDEAYLRFQTANYHRILGDAESSRAFLESAIALDDRHGMTDDGADNRRILATWFKVDEAKIPPAPPAQSTTFRFGWTPSRIEGDSTVEVLRIERGKTSSKTFDVSGNTEIRLAPEGGFRVTGGDAAVQSRSALSSEDRDARLAAFLQQALAKVPTKKVGADGSFLGIEDYSTYRAHLNEATARWIEAEIPSTDTDARKRVEAEMKTFWDNNATSRRFENDFARDHALSTAIWIDSTLTTGELMTLDLNLPLDGVPGAVLAHKVQFRLDGPTPCHAGEEGAPLCVEIELEATPSEEALQEVAANLLKQGKGALHYWSSLNMRVVVDPATLVASETDTRRACYLQLADSAIEAQVYRSHDRSRAHPL